MITLASIRNKYIALRNQIQQVNLFDTYSRDPVVIRQQILTTRLFLVLFSISFLVLLFYTSISPQAINATVRHPSLNTFERLQMKYSDTLQCPCTQISIPHQVFVRVTPAFHQVCYSQFISQEWIDHIFGINLELLWPMDVRKSISAMWQTIASLCYNAMETVNNAWNEFAEQVLITSVALSRQSLQAKTRAAVDTMHQTAVYNLAQSLTMVHRISQANGYLTGTSMNFIFAAGGSVLGQQNSVFLVDTKYNMVEQNRWCLCQRYGSCPVKAGFYLYDRWETTGVYDYNVIKPNQTLNGLYVDCLPILMVSGSTLECFYNRSCLNTLLSVYPRSMNISVLDSSLPSRYRPQTLISNLIDELFLETITNETIFESYYDQCAPSFCSYTYTTRFEIIYVITTLAALLGGLNIGFRLLSPRLISITLWFQEKMSRQQRTNEKSLNQTFIIQSPVESPSFFRKILLFINEFDLFENYHAKDAYDIKHSRFTTRLYLISLVVSMAILTIYTAQSVQTFSRKVLAPTKEQYEQLHSKHPTTLQCPCTTVSIPYESLMSITPTFHQLCQSDFIQPWWYQTHTYHWALTGSFDFRFISSSYFRTLAMFCETARLTIDAAYHRFLSTAYVNAEVIPRLTFEAQTTSFITTFTNGTLLDFVYQVSLVNDMLHADQYASGMETNSYFITWQITEERIANERPLQIFPLTWYSINDDGTYCFCALNSTCSTTTERYVLFSLPGIYVACFLVDTTLKSTLECWYDRSCIDRLIMSFNETRLWVPLPTNITALNRNEPSQFSITDPLENIVNNLMIESYNYSSSYDSFYDICQPIHCSYTYEESSNIIYMITAIIGLFGGMNIVLRLTSQSVINIVHRRARHDGQISVASIYGRPEEIIKTKNELSLLQRLDELNLFSNGSTEMNIIHRQRSQTRLYLTLLSLSIVIIILYTVVPREGSTKTVNQPSLAKYQKLRLQYEDTLQCPCDKISIENKAFMNVSVTFHQVCSSDFIQSTWINSLFMESFWVLYRRRDVTVRGAAYYNLLGKLCRLVQKNIDQAIKDFLNEEFQSSEAISEESFRTHTTATQLQFQARTTRQFSHSLGLFRNITHASTFISSYFLNWYGWLYNSYAHATLPISPVVFDDGCSCGTRNDCLEQSGIFRRSTGALLFEVPGLQIGCSVVETLLRSTLECLFDQNCVNRIASIYQMPSMTALDNTSSSRFNPTYTVEEIMNELFVEQWQTSVSYESFYQACAPKSCEYNLDERRQFLFVISRILGFYGGLTITLRFLTPYFITFIYTIHHYFFDRNRVQTQH